MAAGATTPRPFRAAGSTEALRTAALGANLWAVALLLPVLHGGVRSTLDVVLVVVPLVPLAIGALSLGAPAARALVGSLRGERSSTDPPIGSSTPPPTVHALRAFPSGAGETSTRRMDPRRRALAVAMLLFNFPVALAGVLAARADLADRDAWGALGLLVAACSLLAYGAIATEACARPLELRTSVATALATAQIATEPRARTWLRRAVLGGAMLGGLVIAVVAPAAGSRASLVSAWGEAADEATVLASIVGAAASALAIAGILGPRLRAARPGELPGDARRSMRIAAAMLLATAGGVGYALLRALESRG